MRCILLFGSWHIQFPLVVYCRIGHCIIIWNENDTPKTLLCWNEVLKWTNYGTAAEERIRRRENKLIFIFMVVKMYFLSGFNQHMLTGMEGTLEKYLYTLGFLLSKIDPFRIRSLSFCMMSGGRVYRGLITLYIFSGGTRDNIYIRLPSKKE